MVKKRVKLSEIDGILGKECGNCNEWRSLNYYYKHVKGLGGVKSVCINCEKIYAVNNKKRIKKYKKEYTDKHKEEQKNRRRKSYLNNKEKQKEYNRQWKENNKEKQKEYRRNSYENNKTNIVEYIKKWRKENHEKFKIQKQRRKTLIKELRSDWTLEEKEKTWSFFNNVCALTGETNNIHPDHAIPVSIGHGGTFYGNMYPLCAKLNISKNNNNIFTWFNENKDRFHLSQKRFDILIEYLASLNEMTINEYKNYVFWCHNNPKKRIG